MDVPKNKLGLQGEEMLKVVDLLKMPSLGQSYIVAGHDGMFNVVKKLEIMEEPYPAVLEFLVPYEFMLTNFWSMKDNKEGACSWFAA